MRRRENAGSPDPAFINAALTLPAHMPVCMAGAGCSRHAPPGGLVEVAPADLSAGVVDAEF